MARTGRPQKLTREQHIQLKEYVTGHTLHNGRKLNYREIARMFNLSGPSAVYWYFWRPIANHASPPNTEMQATQHGNGAVA